MSECDIDGLSLLRRLASRSGAIVGAHLQIADRCNHACRHCYQEQGHKGELSTQELFAAIDRLADAGVLMLNVSGGESTLRQDLPEILDHATRRGFAIHLYTNAYALPDALADRIARARILKVHVSVYSAIEAEHDSVTRVPGSLAGTLEGVRRLRARGLSVILKATLMRGMTDPLRAVRELAYSLGCEFRAASEVTPRESGSEAPCALSLDADELLAVGALTPWTPADDPIAERASMLARSPCGVCATSVAVMPNGEIRPCTDTVVPLGHVLETPLHEVLRASPDARFMRELRWSSIHGCRDCDLLPACGRCHASAAHLAGDYLGPYAPACSRAVTRYRAGVGSVRFEASTDAGEGEVPMGPYKIVSSGVLRPVADQLSDEDRRARTAHPWVTAGPEHYRALLGGEPRVRLRVVA